MGNFQFALLIFCLVIMVVLLNILLYKLIVRVALKKFIVPYFQQKNLTYTENKFPGLFKSGDYFLHDDDEQTSGVDWGGIFNTTFVYVFAQNQSGKVIRYTASIHTAFIWIRKVRLKNSKMKEALILPRIR